MTNKPAYRDVRSDLWRASFDRASDYDTYLKESEEQKASRWRNAQSRLPPLSDEGLARLRDYGRKVKILMISGVWCGDCVRQGPMIHQIVEACGPDVELRVIDRDANETLRDEVRILGAMRVPVLVFLSEDFFEMGRFGDRTLTAYRAKAAKEIGAACPVPSAVVPADELAAERDEWIDVFERMLLMARLAPPLRQRYGD